MRLALLLMSFAAVAGCGQANERGCPELDALLRGDPAADAKSALARGDSRLLMVGGFVGGVPAGLDTKNVRILEGTSDTATKACREREQEAMRYATIYNQAIIGGER
jgi:hypothetical protein